MSRRLQRLNSLLKEVISHVIKKEVKHPRVSPFTTITNVNISGDLQHAKVSVSFPDLPEDTEAAMTALNESAGFIAVKSSKKVVLRHFPKLIFLYDSSSEKYFELDTIIQKIQKERDSRQQNNEI